MDPYIEPSGYWGEFHSTMITALHDDLNLRLPKQYAASTDQYVWIHEPDEPRRVRRVKPDAYVVGHSERGGTAVGLATSLERQTILLPEIERKSRRFIKIEDMDFRRVVTTLEFVSPANKKSGDDRDMFLLKRNEYIANRVNLVE